MERELIPRQRLSPGGNLGGDGADDLTAARERILGGLETVDRLLDSIDAVTAEEILQHNRQYSAE